MEDIFDLTGKIIVVTGGTGHLGKDICRGLAAHNAIVIPTSRNFEKSASFAESLSKQFEIKSSGCRLDMLDSDSVVSAFSRVAETFGKIDVLINNASASVSGYFHELNDAKWRISMDGTIGAVQRCIREILPFMLKAGGGKIINVSSMYGLVSPNPSLYEGDVIINNPAGYGAGKSAINQLTRYIAAYYGRQGILCNAVAPGPFPSKTVQLNQAFIRRLEEKTMLGRIGRPPELQGIMVYLTSDASSYMTGQIISVDGGWTQW